MDQNLVRTDLLPMVMPTAVLVGLALASTGAWIAAHYLVKRFLRRLRAAYRVLLVMPIGIISSWLVLQASARFLFLATSWSLFFSAIVAAAALESVAAIYEHEKERVPRKHGRAIVALRLAAIAILFFMIMQPVLIGESKRTVRSRVIVLADDSASMHFVDRQWTDAERVDAAVALGRTGTAKPPARDFCDLVARADSLAGEIETVRELASVGGKDMPKDAMEAGAKLVSDLAAELDRSVPKLSQSRKDYIAELGRLDSHLKSKLVPVMKRLAGTVAAGDAAGSGAAAKEASDALAEARPAMLKAQDLQALAWYDALSKKDRDEVIAATEVPRAKIVRALMNHGGEDAILKKLSDRYDVDVFRFGHGAMQDGSLLDEREHSERFEAALSPRDIQFRSATDMTRALETVMREIPTEEISSVIFFTDGRHTGDAGVESVARKLGSMGVSISSVIVGGTTPPFDLAIAAVQAPESIFVGDKVRFTVNVAATMASGRQAEVTLMAGEEKIDSKVLDITSDDWQEEVRFKHEPEKRGIYKYTVDLRLLDNELFEDNNRWEVSVSVSDDRTNVLLVDNRPRWEFRYLRNLFYGRDKSVHLQDYLITPDTCTLPDGVHLDPLPAASASREFGDSESGAFPQESEEWRKFDLIIIGDLSDSQLSAETVRMIKYCVEERGALLVVIAGPESMPYKVTNPDFRAMLPIEYDPDGQEHRTPPEEEYTFSLTPAGRGHPVMAQSSSSSENEEIWGELPDFHWRIPIKGVKAGSEVLAYARSKKDAEAGDAAVAQSIAATIEEDPEAAVKRLEDIRNEQARNAVVVARTCGRGKVLMMNTDRMWRLRYRVGDTRHHRFWGQVVRWGAGEKLQTGNEFVRLGTDQLRYDVGEPIKVYARFLDYNYGGLQDLEPTVVLTDMTGGHRNEYPLRLRPDSNGFYEGEIPGIGDPGAYQVELVCEGAIEKIGHNFPRHLKTRFVIVMAKQPVETVNITASRDAPTRMAKATKGRVMTPTEWTALTDDFGAGNKTMRDRTEYQLWCMPPLFILLMGLLTAEWIIRKRAKLA